MINQTLMQPYHIAVTVLRGDKAAPTNTKGIVKVHAVEGLGVAIDGLLGGRRWITGNRVNVLQPVVGDVLNVTGSSSRSVQLLVTSMPYTAPHGTTGVLRSMDGITLSFTESGAYLLTRTVGTTTVLMWRSAPLLTPSSPAALLAMGEAARRYEAVHDAVVVA